MNRIDFLTSEISEANIVYAETGENGIPESSYNLYMNELQELDPTNTLIAEIQPIAIKGQKIKHSSPMLSLEKVYTIEELQKWMKKISRN